MAKYLEILGKKLRCGDLNFWDFSPQSIFNPAIVYSVAIGLNESYVNLETHDYILPVKIRKQEASSAI